MLRNRILIAFLLALTLCSASACFAVYPEADGTVCLQMFQGYFDSSLAWYVCTDTSNYRYSQTQDLTFAPKLDSAWGVAAPVYIILNPEATQGPVFSARPGDANYSGIWTVVYVTWTNLDARVPLTSEKQILDAETSGDLDVVPSDPHNVVDYPIVALGELGGTGQVVPDRYIIPQSIEIHYMKKKITLPTFNVSCSDGTTMEPFIKKVIIPDAGDQDLADVLQANFAPALLDIDASNKQAFWVRRGPKPPSEVPIIEFCPNAFAHYNSDKEYSPVMQYIVLHTNIAPSTTVNNKKYLQLLIDNGGLVVARDDQVINAPVLPPKADVKLCSLVIEVCVFDWFLPDKDRIDLYLNGQPLLTNFKLPILLKPKCLDVILKPGDNVFTITALCQGKLDSCTAGIAFSDACCGYVNFLHGYHVELFGLCTGETATIVVRTR